MAQKRLEARQSLHVSTGTRVGFEQSVAKRRTLLYATLGAGHYVVGEHAAGRFVSSINDRPARSDNDGSDRSGSGRSGSCGGAIG